MAAARNPSSGPGARELSALERLEAPDGCFPGHRDILTKSRARYRFVAPHVGGPLLEVGCGRGHGLEALAPIGPRVGVDIAWPFLAEARSRLAGVILVQAGGDRLPLATGYFASVVAFEVIEHLEDDAGFLSEIRRVARPGGYIALSTPNRFATSGGAATPLNPFHVREYTADEFRAILRDRFSAVDLYGQYEDYGSRSLRHRLIDRIPPRIKHLVPPVLQARLSVALRPPLRPEQCRFDSEHLERAHTFVALCRP